MKYEITIKIDVSCDDKEQVLEQTENYINRMLDNASFLSGKDEILEGAEIKKEAA